jgi:alpha-tubulin suppressor-like RCC1 family protein/Mg-chelatase subunit ChlD
MRRSIVHRIVRVVVAVALVLPVLPVAVVSAVTCTDVHAVYATGANNNAGGSDFTQFTETDLHSKILAPVTYSAYALGTGSGFGGFDYQPADSAALFLQGFIGFGPYDGSVQTGVDELTAYLNDRAAQCTNEVYVLGGWSEGADVIGTALFGLSQSIRDRIASVAFFGDPRLDAGNQASLLDPPIPWACLNGQPIWMRGDSGCGTGMGIFGARRPYLPSDIQGRVGSWCRKNDAACTGSYIDILPSVSIEPFTHSRYFDPDAESAMAAREAAFRLQIFLPNHASSFDTSYDQFVSGQVGADLAIVFDTTGSMSGAIADAKAQATDLAQHWTDLFDNGRVGLVDFKDIDQGDPYAARLDADLTGDVSSFQTAVNALSASGGGDYPEAQLSGIMTALDQMSWADGATKAVVVITDAPGKDPEPVTGFTRTSVSQHALQIDPVAIYGVNVSTTQSVTDWMTPMANATAGEVVTLAPGQSLSDALSSLFDSVHANPVAKLDGPIYANLGDAITFNAGDSFSASSTITSYRWDFNGDGVVDQTTSGAVSTHTYSATFHGIASVEVVDATGRSAIAITDVSIDSSGLAPLLPLAPTTVSASVTGTNQVTVSWTPASNDRADAYKVFIANGDPVQFAKASDPHSAIISGVDLSVPQTFYVAASNAFGNSAGTAAPPVGGQTTGAKAWGSNSQGQLGNGTTGGSTTPVSVSTLTGVSALAAGAEHSLAVKSDGTAWAWGQNNNGELGDGTTIDRLTRVQVSGITGASAVAGGTAHSLVLKSNGTVWSFGYNQNGQLGDGTTTQRASAVQVSGLAGVIAIAAGSDHSLALKSDGTVWAWGKNTNGQLGDGSKTKRTAPVRSGTLTGIIAIAAGGDHSLALKSDGTVWAWGYNFYGELGDGTTTNRTSPVRVTGLTGVTGIAAGTNHSLALKSDGTVWAWGNNGLGQLGDGTTTSRKTAVRSGTLSGVTRLAAGAHHSLALKSAGTVWAWGYNLYGQVGDGTTTSRTSAVQVIGLSGIAAIAGGAFFSLAATGG